MKLVGETLVPRSIRLANVYCLLLILVIVGSIAWRATNLQAFSLSNDEGAYLMWAWLVHTGHPLYSETVSVSAPLFIVFLDWFFDIAGVSVVAGRILVLGFLGLALVSLFGVGGLLQHWMAGLTAAIFFSLAPLAFSLSRMTMGEIPALALAYLSVAFAVVYWCDGGWGWLVASGVTLSLSLLVKALNPAIGLPILWLIVARQRRIRVSWARVLGRVVIWGLAGLIPVVVCLAAYDPAAFYDQAVAFRFELRSAFPWHFYENVIWLEYFIRQHWGIVGLALAGIALLAARSRWLVLIPLGLWLGGALLTVLAHSPLFQHHTIILLPPLALLAGSAVAETVISFRERRWVWSGLGLAGGMIFLLALPAAVQANQAARSASFGREAEAIDFLARVTRPGDNVISDNLLLPFMAERQAPPPLGDLAQVAIESGRQTSERLIAISERYPVGAVANWALRLPHLAEYMDWVEDNYLVRRKWDDHHIIYFGRRVSADQVPNQMDVRVGDSMALLGFDFESYGLSDAEEKQTVGVTLYWRADMPVEEDYTVFVQLLGPDGQLVAQHDGQPLYGYLPTSDWSPGEVIPDRHVLPLPPDLPLADYRLTAGMYDLETLVRLPVDDQTPNTTTGDSVILLTLTLP